MIRNGRQREFNLEFIGKFARTIEKMEADGGAEGVDPLLYRAEIESLREKSSELQAEVDEYDRIRSSDPRSYEVGGLADALSPLVKLRISLGMDEAELAGMVGLEERQIVEYESAGYAEAKAYQITEIIGALKARMDARIPRPA